MTALKDTFTSTGHKFFAHTEAMANLRNGKGQPVVTHVMLTDVCQHTCAFCSVQARAGDSLPFDDVMAYIDILRKYGLKAVILSGGGNPILYKCKKTGKNFNDVVNAIHERGLEIGLITNGMPLAQFTTDGPIPFGWPSIRMSWKGIRPETLDKLTWIRLSLAGLDHPENECFVPDIDPSKTTLGMSYVAHDIFYEPADPHHGKVSTVRDLITLDRRTCKPPWLFNDRIPMLTEQIRYYVETYNPKYVRILPDCLDVAQIESRCEKIRSMCDAINPNVVFCQHKPPAPPNACYLGYIHPVLNCDGYVYPCDSVVLAAAELGYQKGIPNHKFDDPWRICHWSEIEKLYTDPVHSLIKEPRKQCQGCVFTQSNLILEGVVDGTADITPPAETPVHHNFV